jgi:adenylosuccinate synthase
MAASLVMGLQWGDEGKGRVVDALAAEADVVVRYNGGANAGHTIVDEQGARRVTHQIPSGIRRAGVLNLIGRGVVVDPFKLAEEVRAWGARPGMLGIDPAAHVTLPVHIEADRGLEALRGRSAIGTTASGNGPTYADKHQRTGVRVIDVLRNPSWSASQLVVGRGVDQGEAERQVRAAAAALASAGVPDMLVNVPESLRRLDVGGRRILFECAHGFELDLDHGQYPNVTSSPCNVGGVCSGAGFDPRRIGTVIGVIKPYSTRVGAGQLIGEYEPEEASVIREAGSEYGSTTGRPRRIAALDLDLLHRASRINGVDCVAITHMDVAKRAGDLLVVRRGGALARVHWTEIPSLVEDALGVPIKYTCHGPNPCEMVGHGDSIWKV